MSAHRHEEVVLNVSAPPAAVFAHLDDFERLGRHMGESSMMMGGGRMVYGFDQGRGQAVGSRLAMTGSAFGLRLSLQEEVVERDPPRRKVWRTLGRPHLLVIGHYELGFELFAAGGGSRLRVWINYELPPGGALLAPLARLYARWCLNRMASEASLADMTGRPSLSPALDEPQRDRGRGKDRA